MKTSLFHKICLCALATLAVTNLLQFPINLLPEELMRRIGQFIALIMQTEVVIAVVVGLTYALTWHQREKENRIDSGWHLSFTHAVIRYWLAYSISVYGFAKILKTQLQSAPYTFDTPIGDMTGFELTWYYFGYSYTLAVILGLIQVGGSILLLFRRTTLLGVIILLPVMVNIILINAFYLIAAGAFFNSVVFTLGLCMLLFADFDKLKAAFWDLVERLPAIGTRSFLLKNLIRALPIVAAFFTIYYYVWKNPEDTSFVGTWRVEQYLKNGQPVDPKAWVTDTTVWQKVYITNWRSISFSPNPYRYKRSENFEGRIADDPNTNVIKMTFANQARKGAPGDTLIIDIKNRKTKMMDMRYVLRRDTIDLHLSKLR